MQRRETCGGLGSPAADGDLGHMTKPQTPDLGLKTSNPDSVIRPLLFAAILLAAAFLRLYRLDSIPPGLTHDEADTGYFVAAVYRGTPSQVETPYGYAYEPFTKYSGALFMALFGPTDLALRFHSVFFGLVLLVFTYLWARRLFGEATGLGSAALVGVSFWTVCDSRFALNSAPAPALFTGAVYFLWLALGDGDDSAFRSPNRLGSGAMDLRKFGSPMHHTEGTNTRWWAWALFIVLLAGSLYVYEAARSAAMAFGAFFLYLAGFDHPRFRRHGAWFAGALAIAGLLAAPHLLDSTAWGRTSTLSGPVRAATQGNLRPLLSNVLGALGTLSFSGDSFVTYNLPGRPIFDPVASLFFYGGIMFCVYRWRTPKYAFILMWLVTGMLPSLILGEWTSTLHSKAAEAPIMALPALCAVEITRFVAARFGPRRARPFVAGCVAWLAVIAASTGYDYFVRWGESPETRAAYFHNLTAITNYLNGTQYSGLVTLSSPFPDLPLDPFIADMRLHRDDVGLRWCNAQRAVVFPGTTHSLLIVPPNTPLAPYFAERLDRQLVERLHLRSGDVDPHFDVFEWDPYAALASFLTSPTRTATAGGQSLPLPVNFGGVVELLDYELSVRTVSPGERVTLVTTWRMLDPAALGQPPAHDYGHAIVLFAHVLDTTDTIVGQEDRLDAPAWNWHHGDAFVQLHSIAIGGDALPAPHRLEVGIYTREDLTRLAVIANGTEIDDHIFLQTLDIASQ